MVIGLTSGITMQKGGAHVIGEGGQLRIGCSQQHIPMIPIGMTRLGKVRMLLRSLTI